MGTRDEMQGQGQGCGMGDRDRGEENGNMAVVAGM